MNTDGLNRRLDKVPAARSQAQSPTTTSAITSLRAAMNAMFPEPPLEYEGVSTGTHRFIARPENVAGTTARDAWLNRCAGGTATPCDRLQLEALPSDALAALGLTPLAYARMMADVINFF